MEIKELVLILIALFGVFLTILAMADPGISLESGAWSTISANASYFILYLAALAIVAFFLKQALGRR